MERGGREKDEPDKRKDLMVEGRKSLLRAMLYWHGSLASPQYIFVDPDESMILYVSAM
jgi:hypothetical protein